MRHVKADDPDDVQEQWVRTTSEPEIRGIRACKAHSSNGQLDRWKVRVLAMDHLRPGPLRHDLCQRMTSALEAVHSVNNVSEQVEEGWLVAGSPSGRALVEAAARVVDGLADKMRAHLRMESITVTASRAAVWAKVSDKSRLGEWNSEYRRRHDRRPDHDIEANGDEYRLTWTTKGSRGLRAELVKWTLALTGTGEESEISESYAMLRESIPVRWLPLSRRARYRALDDALRPDLERLKIIVEAVDWPDPHADDLLTLLNVYTTQFGSYTTLLWQVPALGLTAQAFLLTIALGSNISEAARVGAAVLSALIALASYSLMHSQRGRAINQAELARRTSSKLALKSFLGGNFILDDAVPSQTNAQDVWEVDHSIYQVWKICMLLFGIADLVIVLWVIFGW